MIFDNFRASPPKKDRSISKNQIYDSQGYSNTRDKVEI